MSKSDTMAKLPGLHTRGGVYQLRVVIPLDLRPSFGGQTKITHSLKTTDRREASLVGSKRRAELLQEFQDRRRALNPQPAATIGPELGKLLGERVRATVLQNSQSLRETGGALLSEIARKIPKPSSGLTIGTPKAAPVPVIASPLDGLSDEQLDVLTGLNSIANEHAAIQLAGQRLSAVVPLVDAEARKLGLLIDWNAPEARPVLSECLTAYRIAREDVTRLDAGQVLPAASAPTVPVRSLTLRQVFDRWKPSKPRKAPSTRACELALELFEKQFGNVPVDQINRDQGDAFRTWLQQQGSSSKTASDRFTWVKTLLTYADRDLGLIPRNPWHRLALANQTESRRRPWKLDELRGFFGLPLFTAYAIPPGAKAGADAAYWIPLIGLFTGATVSELAQLRCQDVDADGAVPTLRITDEGENMSTKNAYRVREFPIHSDLIRLGFLEYATTIRNSGAKSLWPSLPLRKDKPGGYFSEWFGEVRKAPPLNFGRHPDFHCLRHTARTAMAEAGFADSVKDRITGHSVRGSDGTKVYEHPIEILRKAVEAIRYPGLDLPKVYERPAPRSSRKRRLTQSK
jgi:integrase